ncbi:MAG: glycosyltransferase [Phycisphaerae bacterium]|nr:glycosyltransferase family 2 protein [Phycisphaerae bacterium]NIT57838.1 glycosyltransferase family 2 protein [Fodinibius sp.]NIU58802.1 glycosyltransferase [Phycisphaerae bacterium]NIV12711.1 glycosyltransferase [Fodinibius sp.]NIW95075.1 glycosyltransferase [Phycisphaerae bacterium]
MKKISIIIPTYNSRSEKKNCIEIALMALLNQTLKDFEVVIVDNATKDNTLTDLLPLFDSFSEQGIRANVVRCENRGNKCLARNMGAEAAKGEILIFMDDDTVLMTNDALLFISENLRRYQFACGAKRYWTVLYWDRQKALAESRANGFDYLKSVAHLPRGIKRGSGMRDLMEFTWIACFGAIYKDDFDKVGGFDINYSGWGRHDMDLMLRLLVEGYSFVNLFDRISVIHLNHKVIKQDIQKKHQNISYYLEKEKNLGFAFKPNLLFGVYEGDGQETLVKKKED